MIKAKAADIRYTGKHLYIRTSDGERYLFTVPAEPTISGAKALPATPHETIAYFRQSETLHIYAEEIEKNLISGEISLEQEAQIVLDNLYVSQILDAQNSPI